MRGALGLALLAALAACGVEGAPERPAPPEAAAPETGLTISGTATIGITGGS